jgi:hypothetical protein
LHSQLPAKQLILPTVRFYMNVAYQEMTEPFRAVFHYHEEVEKMAEQAFLGFNESEKNHFFAFFREIYGTNTSTYQSLHQDFGFTQITSRSLSKYELRQVVSIILPFLPIQQQFEALQYELLNVLQVQKNLFTRHGFRVLNLKDALRMYESLIENAKRLPEVGSQWFHQASFEPSDRRAIAESISYVYLQKIQASIHNFQKDLAIIQENRASFSKKAIYFVKLLGAEVALDYNKIALKKLPIIEILPLPASVGKFATLLVKYLADEAQNLQDEIAQKDRYESLLQNDLQTTLTHYQKSKRGGKKVELQLVLEGAGGFIKLRNTSFWKRLREMPDKVQLFVIPLIAFGGIPALFGTIGGIFVILTAFLEGIRTGNFGNFISIMTILGVGLSWIAIILSTVYLTYSVVYDTIGFVYKSLFQNIEKRIALNYEQKEIERLRLQEYQVRVDKIQTEHRNIPIHDLEQDVLAYLFHKCKSNEYDIFIGVRQNLVAGLQIYKNRLVSIKNLKIVDLPTSMKELAYEDKYAYLSMYQYILRCKLLKSFTYFRELLVQILTKDCDLYFYDTFIEISFQLYTDESYFARSSSFHQKSQKLWQTIKDSMQGFEANRVPTEMQAWFLQTTATLQNHDFTPQIVQIKEQITFFKKNKDNKYMVIAPFLLETEEGILCI